MKISIKVCLRNRHNFYWKTALSELQRNVEVKPVKGFYDYTDMIWHKYPPGTLMPILLTILWRFCVSFMQKARFLERFGRGDDKLLLRSTLTEKGTIRTKCHIALGNYWFAETSAAISPQFMIRSIMIINCVQVSGECKFLRVFRHFSRWYFVYYSILS